MKRKVFIVMSIITMLAMLAISQPVQAQESEPEKSKILIHYDFDDDEYGGHLLRFAGSKNDYNRKIHKSYHKTIIQTTFLLKSHQI